MQDDMDKTAVRAVAGASAVQRFIAIGAILILAALFFWFAIARPVGMVGQIGLLLLGGGAVWLANQMRIASTRTIELTGEVLRQSDGTVLALFDDILSVNRGAFASKPSNGFSIKTRVTAPRAWYPGLWWRFGQNIGVGGMIPGHQTKAMTEVLSLMIAQRDQDTDV